MLNPSLSPSSRNTPTYRPVTVASGSSWELSREVNLLHYTDSEPSRLCCVINTWRTLQIFHQKLKGNRCSSRFVINVAVFPWTLQWLPLWEPQLWHIQRFSCGKYDWPKQKNPIMPFPWLISSHAARSGTVSGWLLVFLNVLRCWPDPCLSRSSFKFSWGKWAENWGHRRILSPCRQET